MTNLKSVPIIQKGEGHPLIFLHGFMCSKEFFNSQINYFSRYFKVVAYDSYGFGENLPSERVFNLTDYANEFINLALSFGDKVSVVAHSFGCRIVLKSFEINPNLIEKAVLCGVAGLKPSFSVKKFAKRTAYKLFRPFLTKERCEKLFFSPDYNMLLGSMKQTFKLVTSEYLDGVLPLFNCPTLAVFGEKDDQTPPKIASKMVKRMPNCGKYLMNGCGHFCFAEKAKEFNTVVKEFLV